MARYGLPNPTKGVTSLSRGSQMDIKATNPAASKAGFSVKATMPKDEGMTPHKLGVKTQTLKRAAKSAMGK